MKPISVIITTLAGYAYSGEDNLYETLIHILDNMASYIEIRNGVFWIPNPVMNEENFADKWQQNPDKQQAFKVWASRARNDLITLPLKALGLDQVKNIYSTKLGEAPVNRAFNQLGEEIRKIRDAGNLVSVGLTAGLTTGVSPYGHAVRRHTFFGK